ncbi:MAG: tetratricopeptide repeat protein [Planctomycetota bacterium]
MRRAHRNRSDALPVRAPCRAFRGCLYALSLTLGMTLQAGCLVFHDGPPMGIGPQMEIVKSTIQPRGTLGSSSGPLVTVKRGNRLFQKGDLAGAEQAYASAVELNPNNGQAHNNLGLVYYRQHRLALAATHFQLASELRPNDALPKSNLGMTLERAGRINQAVEHYRVASQIDPTQPLHLGNLVRAKVRRGDRDELLRAQLEQLLMIENRPKWIRWTHDQLSLEFNPFLDRGGNPVQLSGRTPTEERASSTPLSLNAPLPKTESLPKSESTTLPEPVVIPPNSTFESTESGIVEIIPTPLNRNEAWDAVPVPESQIEVPAPRQ